MSAKQNLEKFMQTLDTDGKIQYGSRDTEQMLLEWVNSEAYELTSITRDATGNITSATILWPDGSGGTFTATDYNSSFDCYDGYTATYDGTTPDLTATQSAVTRDANGNITTKPSVTIS